MSMTPEGYYTDDEVYERLMDAIQQAGSQKAFANAHGCSPQYVNDLVLKRRVISETVLHILKLRKVIVDDRTDQEIV